MLHLIALLGSSYLTFVFFSESFNPISKPKLLVLRARWKYGRRMALAVFAGMSLAIVLIDVGSLGLVLAGIAGGALFLVMGLCFSAERIVHVLRG